MLLGLGFLAWSRSSAAAAGPVLPVQKTTPRNFFTEKRAGDLLDDSALKAAAFGFDLTPPALAAVVDAIASQPLPSAQAPLPPPPVTLTPPPGKVAASQATPYVGDKTFTSQTAAEVTKLRTISLRREGDR